MGPLRCLSIVAVAVAAVAEVSVEEAALVAVATLAAAGSTGSLEAIEWTMCMSTTSTPTIGMLRTTMAHGMLARESRLGPQLVQLRPCLIATGTVTLIITDTAHVDITLIRLATNP